MTQLPHEPERKAFVLARERVEVCALARGLMIKSKDVRLLNYLEFRTSFHFVQFMEKQFVLKAFCRRRTLSDNVSGLARVSLKKIKVGSAEPTTVANR